MKVGDVVRPRFAWNIPSFKSTATVKLLESNQAMFEFQMDREQEFKVSHVESRQTPEGGAVEVIQVNGQPFNWMAVDWEVVDPNAPPPPPPAVPGDPVARVKELIEIGRRHDISMVRHEVIRDLGHLFEDACKDIESRHGGEVSVMEIITAAQAVVAVRMQPKEEPVQDMVIPALALLHIKVKRGP